MEVFCDMVNGGWTIIQKRMKGRENFYRDWKDYKAGFGRILDEHWIGNQVLHQITNQEHYKLRIEMTDWQRATRTVTYDRFRISNEEDGFRLFVAGYNKSPAGDSLRKHNRKKFSTKDVDNDDDETHFGGSCAQKFTGAWWYYNCYKSNLNGVFYPNGKVPADKFNGIVWKTWTGASSSLKKVEMKIRPARADDVYL
ncbi:hypothetical protein HELRODRAFT_157115 [Helobdella robusta]|uniref:Fibrinogen C-terminal domain-containing protein n=1 Tax=Helobdella robusta TaxID=6412 RepID=T1EM63_HELRO|nr:hypothetical protein HELRODRAFT_157115 [Helobdella robusta]ESO03350.1 hypothetical protein HELRODRAFT_157115 [Helobdella robusta]